MSGNSPLDQSASPFIFTSLGLLLDFKPLILGDIDRRLSTRDGAGANAPVMGTHKKAIATATESKRPYDTGRLLFSRTRLKLPPVT
eukprot:scaffold175957_cov60-Attheya_sp.AAC.7